MFGLKTAITQSNKWLNENLDNLKIINVIVLEQCIKIDVIA
jgi:hypothetical protein